MQLPSQHSGMGLTGQCHFLGSYSITGVTDMGDLMDFGFTKLLRTVVCGVQLRSLATSCSWGGRGPGDQVTVDLMQHLLPYKMMG